MREKTDPTENRYEMRQEPDGTWTVYDIFTGLPAVVNDIPITMLTIEEADDAVDLLNNLYIDRRGGTTQ
ncbi:MAG: hypothetical protein JWM58_1657 [Rhizobium sp.]|nr:hypothetical protein [Rhizobium sp.]